MNTQRKREKAEVCGESAMLRAGCSDAARNRLDSRRDGTNWPKLLRPNLGI